MIDIIVLIIVILAFARGFSRGFLRSILAPIAMIVASIGAMIYFKATHDPIISLLIGLFGPLCIQLIVRLFIRTHSIVSGEKIEPSVISRFAGAGVTTVWALIFIGMSLILLAMIPAFNPTMTNIQNSVRSSIAFAPLKIFVPLEQKPKTSTPHRKRSVEEIAKDPDIQALYNDPRLKEIFKDRDIVAAIEQKNIAGLMTNPKIMALTQDTELMGKLMKIYAKLAEEGINLQDLNAPHP